tara:strand:+ start:307 stop:921 length:615 start_codon:yes stop_codon:yes gene_type:complete
MDEVKDTAQGTMDVAGGVKDDIIQLNFYKNPIFIIFMLYVVFIFGIYFNMSNIIKNNYVFNGLFRDDAGDIHWIDLISYPYDFSESLSNKVKILVTSPIMLYLLIGLYLIINIIDPLQKRNQAYFYSIMFSYLLILVLFTIHIIIFNFVIDPKDTQVELRLGDPDSKKTYSLFYRTQWLLLIVFSPIIITTLVYAIRKLDKSSN